MAGDAAGHGHQYDDPNDNRDHEQGWLDANLIIHAWLDDVSTRQDAVVVDQARDLTKIQPQLILHSLRDTTAFMRCGDSNVIVQPKHLS